MAKKVLVVDDEKPISDIIKFNLEKEGYEVVVAYDGEEALQKVESESPDLIVLDLMLPKIDGLEVAKQVRAKRSTPIIMVTAKDSELDKVLGLELGADDYVTKPFSNRELVARVKANLRRQDATVSPANDDRTADIKVGGFDHPPGRLHGHQAGRKHQPDPPGSSSSCTTSPNTLARSSTGSTSCKRCGATITLVTSGPLT